MKHIRRTTKQVPVKACFIADHPGIKDSIEGFVDNPLCTILLHVGKGC